MKRAIVIGASSGIGRELAKILIRNQYQVGCLARRVDLLESLRKETNSEILVQQIDISEAERAMDTLTEFINIMGGVDLIVISAGTGEVNTALEWQLENEIIKTNVTGFAAMANVAVHHFEERGSGHLVGISSIAALRGGKGAPAYHASKAFQSNYMEGLRQKFKSADLPITVTDVKPGFVQTAMAKGDGIFWSAPAEKAALQIFEAIKRRKSSVYITRRWRLIAWLMKLLPAPLHAKL
jgi:short-subunit dehydrogenase